MTTEEARQLLAGTDEEAPVALPSSLLRELSVDDLPGDVAVQVGETKDGIIHLEWEGQLYREGDTVVAEADYTWTRKYWYESIGLGQYLDLVRRAVETRHRTQGDVELTEYDDDGAYIHLRFTINTRERNLGRAFDAARTIAGQMAEAAQKASDTVGAQIAQVAARLSGWGMESLDHLVDSVERATSADDKGRSLEELCSRLFAGIPGLSVTGRIRTATEEIDLSILNDSTDPRLRREAALILAECKNWNGKCGKDELVVFREKIENRNQRCTLGFLISWNGFTRTVTKELLRGCREGILIVPMTGEDLRAASRTGDFLTILLASWDQAVTL